jgi:KTSC domain
MVRPTGGGGTRGKRVSQPSAQELMTAIAGQFGPRQLQGMAQITGPQYKGLPTASSYGEFDEIISLIKDKDTMKYFVKDQDQVGYNNYGEEPDMQDEEPAELTVVPTSTINPERPRTVAAGYDKLEEKITVVFRDGTFYNYYEVSPTEWQRFKAVVSKGRYIMAYLDSKPRGDADVSGMSQTARRAFYQFSRAAQRHYQGRPDKYGKTPKPKKP